MSDIKLILENGGYEGMLVMALLAIGYLVFENRILKKEVNSLNTEIRSILNKTTMIFDKVISSGELNTGNIVHEIKLLKERVDSFIEAHKNSRNG